MVPGILPSPDGKPVYLNGPYGFVRVDVDERPPDEARRFPAFVLDDPFSDLKTLGQLHGALQLVCNYLDASRRLLDQIVQSGDNEKARILPGFPLACVTQCMTTILKTPGAKDIEMMCLAMNQPCRPEVIYRMRAVICLEAGLTPEQADATPIPEAARLFRATLRRAPDETVRRKGPIAKATPLRDKKTEARDKWIYDQCCKRELTYDGISRALKRDHKDWEPIDSATGVLAAAKRYAKRHGKPKPPPRLEQS